MAYHMLPFRGLVFASMPASNISMSTEQPSTEDLMLCADAMINRAIIKYEDWLQNSIFTLRGPLYNTKIKSSQLHTHKKLKKKLIEEITLAIKDFHAAKREEWSHQLAAINLQMPLLSFVVDNQCFIVDGGQSQYPLSISLVSEVLIAKLLSREISRL